MAYRLSGQSTELCSCNAPCPCAAGPTSVGAWCEGMLVLDIQDGELDGVNLAGTKAIVAVGCAGLWTGGNFPGALILDAGGSAPQREALTDILTGKLGGDAASLAAMIGDLKGVFTAPIAIDRHGDQITVRAGDLAEGTGGALPGLDETMPVPVANAQALHAQLIAGRSTKSRVRVPGLEFDHDGSGMWFGPFAMTG